MRNGGSDPHFADGLTRLGLPVRGFRMIGERTRKLSRICQGKHVDLIASGYNETVLPYGWFALVSGMAGFDVRLEEPVPIPERLREDLALEETKRVIAQVKSNLKDYWRCFQ